MPIPVGHGDAVDIEVGFLQKSVPIGRQLKVELTAKYCKSLLKAVDDLGFTNQIYETGILTAHIRVLQNLIKLLDSTITMVSKGSRTEWGRCKPRLALNPTAPNYIA